ncbi:MAG: hypothetical protein KAR39_04535 [Thermoplasmata archaeon]|nr:hypothetical protein [Thermoplasmata archaeon]
MGDLILSAILIGFCIYLYYVPLTDEEKQINIKAEYEEDLEGDMEVAN